MKIKLLTFALTLAASAGIGFAQDANSPGNLSTVGTFGFGIELDGTGATATNSGVTTLYALDNSGTTRLLPIEPANTGSPSSATLNSSWSSASTAASPTFSLGTFTEGVGTLTLDGGSILTYKNSGQNVNSTDLNYQIFLSSGSPGSYTQVSLPFNQDSVAGNTGDQRWATESGSTNLLTGLTPGTYVLDVYGQANTDSSGTIFNTGGSANNYGATFTVVAAAVPEPSAWAMMLGGLGLLACFQVLRRKSVA